MSIVLTQIMVCKLYINGVTQVMREWIVYMHDICYESCISEYAFSDSYSGSHTHTISQYHIVMDQTRALTTPMPPAAAACASSCRVEDEAAERRHCVRARAT